MLEASLAVEKSLVAGEKNALSRSNFVPYESREKMKDIGEVLPYVIDSSLDYLISLLPCCPEIRVAEVIEARVAIFEHLGNS